MDIKMPTHEKEEDSSAVQKLLLSSTFARANFIVARANCALCKEEQALRPSLPYIENQV